MTNYLETAKRPSSRKGRSFCCSGYVTLVLYNLNHSYGNFNFIDGQYCFNANDE